MTSIALCTNARSACLPGTPDARSHHPAGPAARRGVRVSAVIGGVDYPMTQQTLDLFVVAVPIDNLMDIARRDL